MHFIMNEVQLFFGFLIIFLLIAFGQTLLTWIMVLLIFLYVFLVTAITWPFKALYKLITGKSTANDHKRVSDDRQEGF